MLLAVKISLYVFVISFLTLTVNAQLPGAWPQADSPPPPNDEWTKLVDQSKVPNAPLSNAEGECGANDDFCKWSCTPCTRPDIDVIQCPNKYDWGLTFDDGPTLYTDTLLDYLSSIQIKTTFFVVGSRVIENPQILKKAIDAGHQIGAHTWSHTALTKQTNEEIIAEMKWTELAIKQAVGVIPKYMRPPFGDFDDRVRGILSQLGYKIVVWDKDTDDWMSASDKSFQLGWIEGNFTEWVKEDDSTGHISLEHDLYEQTAAQGPKVIPIVQGAGFTIKPVAECLGDAQPYQDSAPVAPTSPTSVTSSVTVAPVSPTPVSPTPVTVSTVVKVVPDPTDPSGTEPTTVSQEPITSNAISYMNKNSYLLSFVLFIVVSYFT